MASLENNGLMPRLRPEYFIVAPERPAAAGRLAGLPLVGSGR